MSRIAVSRGVGGPAPENFEFAETLLGRMTLAEKAAQMAQVEKNSITPDLVAELGIGSVLSGGGGNPDPNTPGEWRRMVLAFEEASRRSRLGIPILYGTDAVHGHSNVRSATIFPHNIGLGATADAELVREVYRATALECAATGALWDFAPAVSVCVDPRWGRCFESFGDDPTAVAELGAAAVRGLQGAGEVPVVACAKHFIGDGGTEWGTAPRMEWTDFWDGWHENWMIDQGDYRSDETELRRVHLPPFRAAIEAGCLTVMASYSSWNGTKAHGHSWLLTQLLKDELGFQGFVVSDWLAIDQLGPDPYSNVVTSVGAGVDMVMVPFEYERFIDNVAKAVSTGDLTEERVDDAVRRILAVKHAAGLFDERTLPELSVVGCSDHRKLAREAVGSSAVLLRNQHEVLPLKPTSVLVAGKGADDIGLQCGGWTIEWQGAEGPITTGTTLLDGLQAADGFDVTYSADGAFSDGARAPVGIAVVAEPPYAEGMGDRVDLSLPAEDVALVERLAGHVDHLVLIVISGRPIDVSAVVALCDAVVAAWLPGSEADGIVDVLVGRRPFTGRLPRPWPGDPGWDRGHGLG